MAPHRSSVPGRTPAPHAANLAANGSVGGGSVPRRASGSGVAPSPGNTTDSFDKLDVFGTGAPRQQSRSTPIGEVTGHGHARPPIVPPKPTSYVPRHAQQPSSRQDAAGARPAPTTQRQGSTSSYSGGAGQAQHTRVQWNMNTATTPAHSQQQQGSSAHGRGASPAYHTLNVHFSGTITPSPSSSAVPAALAPPPPGMAKRPSSGSGAGYSAQQPPPSQRPQQGPRTPQQGSAASATGPSSLSRLASHESKPMALASAGSQGVASTGQQQKTTFADPLVMGRRTSRDELADFDPLR